MKRLLVAAMASLAMLSFARADEGVQHMWWENPGVVSVTARDSSWGHTTYGPYHMALSGDFVVAPSWYGAAGHSDGVQIFSAAALAAGDNAEPITTVFSTDYYQTCDFYGAGVCPALNVALVGCQATTNALSIPLDKANPVLGEDMFYIGNDLGIGLNQFVFSDDGSKVYAICYKEFGESTRNFVYEFEVLNNLKTTGNNLKFVKKYDFGQRIRSFAMAEGIAYTMLEDKSIGVMDLEAETPTASTLIAADKLCEAQKYGGISVCGSILTLAESAGSHNALEVFQLAEGGLSLANEGKPLASFNEAACVAFGLGETSARYGISAFTMPDGSLIVGWADNKIYTVKYVPPPVAKIGEKTYTSLADAFADANAGEKIELLCDAAVDATIVPTVAVTLDLAGKTLSSAGAATIFDTAVALTITNGVATLGTAKFINIDDGANVAVNDVKVSGSSDPIFYSVAGGSKTLTIGKGTVVLVAGNSWFDFRDTTLNLYGSVTNAPGGNGAACWPCSGTNVVNVYEGASLTSEREDFFRNNRGQVTYNIYGGTFYCPNNAFFYSYYKAKNGTQSPVFNIYGGTFESTWLYNTTDGAEFVEPIVTKLDDACLAKFKGNAFGKGYTLADFCASGYEPVKGDDGYYTIQKAPVAKIGDKTFKTLNEAFAAAQKDDMIELLDNLAMTENLRIEDKENVVFNLAGKTLSAAKAEWSGSWIYIYNSGIVITNGTIDINTMGDGFEIDKGSEVTLAVDATITCHSVYCVCVYDAQFDIYGTIINEEVEQAAVWLLRTGTTVNVYDTAVLKSADDVFRHRSKNGSATLNIYGGTMESTEPGCWAMFHVYGEGNTGFINIYGGQFTTPDNSFFEKPDGVTYRPFDGQVTARFNKKGDLADLCAEGYGPKKDGDWYVIAELPTVEPVSIGGKGTLTVDQSGSVAFGSKISGTITEVAAGFVPFVFVDGVKVAVDPTTGAFEGVANNSAKVVATFAKDSAWYLDPFIRFTLKNKIAGYSPIGATMNASESHFFMNRDPGAEKNGLNIINAQALKNTLNPSFDSLIVGNSEIEGTGIASWRQIGPNEKYQTILGFGYYSQDADGNRDIPSLKYDGTNGKMLAVDWTAAGGKYNPRNLNDVVTIGDFAYFQDDEAADPVMVAHKFAINTDEGGNVAGLTYVDTISGIGYRSVGRTIGGKDYLFSFNNGNEFYVTDLAAGTTVTNVLSVPSAIGSMRRMSITGLADGVPHMIMHGDNYVGVWALTSDAIGVACTTPIAWVPTASWNTVTGDKVNTYASLVSFDDEMRAFFAAGYSQIRVEVLEKKPAKLIVRGTFSDEAHAEDDVLVDFGGAAEVPFAAPAGKKIVGVKVNGVADANFTDAAYTFTDAALTKNVYVEMTVDDLPVAQIGTTTYKTLNAAFAAAKTGDTVELLRDVTVADPITVADFKGTLDLGGFSVGTTFTADAYITFNGACDVVITNGTMATGSEIDIAGTAVVTVAANTTLNNAGNYGVYIYGTATLNIYGTINNTTGEMPCVWMGGSSTVNAYEGCVVNSTGDAFRINGSGRTLNIYGGTFHGGYPIVYVYNANTSAVNIYGGIFDSDNGFVGGGAKETVVVAPLTDACKAKFSQLGSNTWFLGLDHYCASGFEPVKGEDGYYTIQKASVQPADPEKPIPSTDPAGDAAKMNNPDGSVKPEFIKVPEGVTMDGPAKAAYAALFTAVPGVSEVTIELNEAGTNEVKAAEQVAGTAALDAVLGADGDKATMEVKTPLAGFFYSLKQSSAIKSLDFKEGDKNKLGGRDTINFSLDKSEASGFYQMIVSPVPEK